MADDGLVSSSTATSLASGAASGAAAGAIGGPWGMAAGAAIGLGLSAWGAWSNYETTKESSAKQNALQMQMFQTEQSQDAVRRRAMELDASRRSMEVLRNTQRARSLALINATSGGAQLGSGLVGGLGQIGQQGAWQIGGISDALISGRQMFDLNAQLGQQRLQAGLTTRDTQTSMAFNQGIQSIGTNVLGSLGQINRLSRGVDFNQPQTAPAPVTPGEGYGGV